MTPKACKAYPDKGRKVLKPKKCSCCGEEFKPKSLLQVTCSIGCAIQKVRRDSARRVKKDIRARRASLMTLREHLAKTQQVVNAYIRERDKDEPCISCGRYHKGQYQAGHYRTVGAAAHLRFHEDNIHKQCTACNNHLSGNLTNYRIRLIQKIGLERVEALESNNEVVKFTIADAVRIKLEYRAKLKALKGGA